MMHTCILGPDGKPIGEWMKDQLAKKQPASRQMELTGDSPRIQATKRLVEQMIQPEANHRCKMDEACTQFDRIRGIIVLLHHTYSSSASFWQCYRYYRNHTLLSLYFIQSYRNILSDNNVNVITQFVFPNSSVLQCSTYRQLNYPHEKVLSPTL